MGNICSDPNSLSKKGSATKGNTSQSKTFDQNSSIKFQILTWKGQLLPDLRNVQHAQKNDYVFNNSGTLFYNENKDNIIFFAKQQKSNQKQSLESDSANNKVLSMNVQKNKKSYVLTFGNQFIYELISKPRQIIEGDRILLGGTEYKFVKLVHDPKYGANKVKKLSDVRDPALVRTTQYLRTFSHIPDQNPSCRICLSEQISKEDPLICPCNCTGSVKYFHLKCWSSWSFSSQTAKQGIYIGNVIKEECQLCKKNLLDDQYYRDTVAALLSSAAKIKTPFIVLQGLKPLERYPYYRSTKLNYLIMSFADKKSYTIGRGHADIPLQIDSSISRKNTQIYIDDGKVFIEDLQSKHGTYLRIQPPIFIKDDIPKSFLFKNHLFNVNIA